MNCDEYLPLISGHLDGANSGFEERRLQEHLQTCEACRALLSQMEQNDALLKGSAAAPPADLTERIMREVRKEKQPKTSKSKRWIPVAVSGLAAAAVLSLVFWGNLPGLNSSPDAVKAGTVETEAAEAVEMLREEAAGPLYGSTSATTATLAAIDTPVVTESPVETDASITNAAPDDVDTTEKSIVPDFPAYSDDMINSTEGTSSEIRHITFRPSAPMLIVWGADSMDALADFAPEDLNEYAPLTARLSPSLYERCQAVLPLLREFDTISPAEGYGITVYTVSYETMKAVFNECIGVYENAIYYPVSFTAPDECIVVLVNLSE